MKIADIIEQLEYTHPVPAHVKKVFEVIKGMEEAYISRIANLEQDIALSSDQMAMSSQVNRDAEPYPGHEYNRQYESQNNQIRRDYDDDFPYDLNDVDSD